MCLGTVSHTSLFDALVFTQSPAHPASPLFVTSPVKRAFLKDYRALRSSAAASTEGDVAQLKASYRDGGLMGVVIMESDGAGERTNRGSVRRNQ